MLQPPEGKTFALISNAPEKGLTLNYSYQPPPTKMGENPTIT
jgi:hypothetical protein